MATIWIKRKLCFAPTVILWSKQIPCAHFDVNSNIKVAFLECSSHHTPRLWRVRCNSFDIVCLSVSVCLCVSFSLSDIQTWILAWGQVKKHLGQNYRFKVKVTGSKILFIGNWEFFVCKSFFVFFNVLFCCKIDKPYQKAI